VEQPLKANDAISARILTLGSAIALMSSRPANHLHDRKNDFDRGFTRTIASLRSEVLTDAA
jgi:hypothetical protein